MIKNFGVKKLIFIQQVCINSIKGNSEDINDVAKYSILNNPLSKNPGKKCY